MVNSNNPKVSVIVPNYNHAPYLRQRLDSIFGQTFQDFEVVLLDDCSTDDSQSILREYSRNPRVAIEFNKKNSGCAFKQWNKGVRLARGEYIWIAESDDYADKTLLEKLVSRLQEDPASVLCNCRSWRVAHDGVTHGFLDLYLERLDKHRWAADFSSDGHEECEKYLVFWNTVLSASSVVFRKETYNRVGGADESLLYCGDWKLWASMLLDGGRITYVGQPLNYYRFHEATVTAKSRRNGVDAIETLRVIRWVLNRIHTNSTTRTRVCEEIADLWCSRTLTGQCPLSRRWAILNEARAIDPHALRRLLKAAVVALRLTLARRYRELYAKLRIS